MRSQLSLLFILLAVSLHVHATGDPTHGLTLYQTRCAGCHSMDYNGTGPAHKGVFGRKAGSAPGYVYSAAVKSSKVIWSEKTIDKWLKNPEKFIPGQKMGFMMPDAKDRADVIAYLSQASVK